MPPQRQVRAAGGDLLLVTDSAMAAIHEARAGRIGHDRVEQVRVDEEVEKRLPPPTVEAEPAGGRGA